MNTTRHWFPKTLVSARRFVYPLDKQCTNGCHPGHRGYKYEATVSAIEETTASFSQMEYIHVANTQIKKQSTASTQKLPCTTIQSLIPRLTTKLTVNSTDYLGLFLYFKQMEWYNLFSTGFGFFRVTFYLQDPSVLFRVAVVHSSLS